MKWTPVANNLSVTENSFMSFFPGSVLIGTVQPYMVGTMAPNSHLHMSILISIASPKVFHLTLHTGSHTEKTYRLQTFPGPSSDN